MSSNLKSFLVEIPEAMFNKDLTPFAFTLYFHIKVVAIRNGGICSETTREMATHCRMSTGKISDTKKELVEAGLIEIRKGKGQKVDTIKILI